MFKPPKSGQPWRSEDDDQLKQLVESGKHPALIAARLNRSKPAIRTRMSQLKISVRRPKNNEKPGTGRE
jgi:hypothetical protein